MKYLMCRKVDKMLRPTNHVSELLDKNRVWLTQDLQGKKKKRNSITTILTMNLVYLQEYRELLREFKKFKKYINSI